MNRTAMVVSQIRLDKLGGMIAYGTNLLHENDCPIIIRHIVDIWFKVQVEI